MAKIIVKKLNNQTDAVQKTVPDPSNEIRWPDNNGISYSIEYLKVRTPRRKFPSRRQEFN